MKLLSSFVLLLPLVVQISSKVSAPSSYTVSQYQLYRVAHIFWPEKKNQIPDVVWTLENTFWVKYSYGSSLSWHKKKFYKIFLSPWNTVKYFWRAMSSGTHLSWREITQFILNTYFIKNYQLFKILVAYRPLSCLLDRKVCILHIHVEKSGWNFTSKYTNFIF